MTWFKLWLLCLMLLPATVRAEGGTVSAGSHIIPLGMVAADRLDEAAWPSVGYIYERVTMMDYDLWTWNGQFCTYYKAGGQTKYDILKPDKVAGLMGKPEGAVEIPWRYRLPNGLLGIVGIFAGSVVLRMLRAVADSKPKTPKSVSLPATPQPAWKPAPAEPVSLQAAPVLPPPVTDPAALPALKPVGSEPQGLGQSSGPATTRKPSSQITPTPSLPPPTQVLPPPASPAPMVSVTPPVPAPAPARKPATISAPVAPATAAAPTSLLPRSPMLALVFRPFEDSASDSSSKPSMTTSRLPARESASPPAEATSKKEARPSRPEPIFWEIPPSALKESGHSMAIAG